MTRVAAQRCCAEPCDKPPRSALQRGVSACKAPTTGRGGTLLGRECASFSCKACSVQRRWHPSFKRRGCEEKRRMAMGCFNRHERCFYVFQQFLSLKLRMQRATRHVSHKLRDVSRRYQKYLGLRPMMSKPLIEALSMRTHRQHRLRRRAQGSRRTIWPHPFHHRNDALRVSLGINGHDSCRCLFRIASSHILPSPHGGGGGPAVQTASRRHCLTSLS